MTPGTPLEALLTGGLTPLGERAAPSGIAKLPVNGPLHLSKTGFAGDHQGDLKHHGGPEKAVHHYPLDHYGCWQGEIGPHPLLDQPGAFGENLSTFGLVEADVAIGDVFRLGSALLEVSQGRQPCWKLNARFDHPAMARQVQETGRTGWYYRVLEEGLVAPGDSLIPLELMCHGWTIRRIWHFLYVDPLNREALSAIAGLGSLSESWRKLAAKRLATLEVEGWEKRLTGEAF
ncbi:MOSC domain-containing protein [Lacibacterium aquatile]|uniref:MOSC domain-containing protein n=1 Tax=Lacibacterium aquatile TaxID=1168082 RepID=A0ABW5DWW5_9PROT